MKVNQVYKVYAVFKHVWTDSSDDVKEYELVGIFKNIKDAQDFITVKYSINRPHPFYGSLEIDPLLLTKELSPYKLQWSNKYLSWSYSDTKLYKSASLKSVLHLLEKYKPEDLQVVEMDHCNPSKHIRLTEKNTINNLKILPGKL